jgi:asparagine synthase (glutamine-hydrolysing)
MGSHRMLYRRLHRKVRDFARRHLPGLRPAPLAEAVTRAALSYAEPVALDDLHRCVRRLEAQGVPGVLIEAGCALGGSAIVIAGAKRPERVFEVYDVFGMPPPPGAGDGPDVVARYEEVSAGRSAGIGGQAYYGYRGDLLPQVRANFVAQGIEPEAHRVRFVRGLLQHTLPERGAVAFAHIDCDRYASVRTCLERIAPRLSRGGVLVIDDYLAWSGCRKAVDEYFAPRRREFRLSWQARLHVERR